MIDSSSDDDIKYCFNPVFPITGSRKYEDVDGFTCAVNSEHSLLALVLKHRQEVGGDLNPGWKLRVVDRFFHQNPDLPCKSKFRGKKRALDLSDVKNFITTMRHWAALSKKTVHQGEADRRALICSECPMNVTIDACWGCGGIKKVLDSFLKDKTTKHDLKLNGCYVCGCYLKSKVHLPAKCLTPSAGDPERYPEGCWIREALESGD